MEGGNLWMEGPGAERFGYFTTRYVEGRSKQEAAECALKLVQNELGSAVVLLNGPDDPPNISVDEIEQVSSFEGELVPGKGFTFFPGDRSD
jgi:hypothetical protein